MTNQELLDLFQEMGVLQTGHFKLTSGRHSAQYMQCAALFEHPLLAAQVIQELLPRLPESIDTVIAPAIGGINAGYELARALGCRFIFAERQDGVMTLRRGFNLSPTEDVLVVEDVVTTGGSVREVLEIVHDAGCKIQGVAAIVDRSGGNVDFGVPFASLMSVDIETYDPTECPLCLNKVPITKPGSRSS